MYNTVHVKGLSNLNSKTNENIKIASAAKTNNLNVLKSRLNGQQLAAVQEVIKRFK